MEAIPKAGILVGIAATCIFLSIWVAVTVAENEYLFARVFFDRDLHLEKIEQTESYKAMMDRYPDSTITTRKLGGGVHVEMFAYDDDGNELAVRISYDPLDPDVRAHARCSLLDSGERRNLGTTPPEVIDDRSIPKRMFLTGNAHNEFSANFIKHTNCLDAKTPKVEDDLEADHYVAIPEGTEFPGCQESLSCFEPYSLKIKVGDVVSFRNFGSVPHTVTSGFLQTGPDGEFDSGVMKAGDQFLHKFTDADEYDYYCILHPWKAGKIIVHE